MIVIYFHLTVAKLDFVLYYYLIDNKDADICFICLGSWEIFCISNL